MIKMSESKKIEVCETKSCKPLIFWLSEKGGKYIHVRGIPHGVTPISLEAVSLL